MVKSVGFRCIVNRKWKSTKWKEMKSSFLPWDFYKMEGNEKFLFTKGLCPSRESKASVVIYEGTSFSS